MHRKSTLPALVGLAALALWFPVRASALITVGELDTPGEALDVEVAGGIAFVADGSGGLLVVDVSNPALPVLLGSSLAAGYTEKVEVVDGIAYVAGSSSRVMDVSVPTAPAELATFAYAFDLVVVGDLLFAVAGGSGLTILDVSDPRAPAVVGTFDDVGYFERIAVEGGLAYVADRFGGLRVIDVSDPAAPHEIGTLPVDGTPTDVEVVSDVIYLCASGLRVIDVSDPAVPALLATLDTCTDVEVQGEVVWVTDRSTGLRALDVSNPASPTPLGALDTPGFAMDVEVASGYAHVADGSGGGLRIIDLSNPTLPAEIGSFVASQITRSVEVAGHLAYLLEEFGHLRVLDVSNPQTPHVIGDLQLAGFFGALALEGDRLYVGGGSLHVIDVSDPSSPQELGSLPAPETVRDVDVSGGLAFAAVGESGLWIVDVSNPAQAVELGLHDTPGYAFGIDVDGGVAYLANSHGGIGVVDVSNPGAPTDLGGLALEQFTTDVEVVRGLAYVTGYTTALPSFFLQGWLRVLDASKPAALSEVGALRLPAEAFDVAVVDGLAYVAARGVRAIDVSNPAAPRERGATGIDLGLELDVADGLVYTGFDGLRVVDFGPEYVGAPSARSVGIDVRPGSRRNRLDPRRRGPVPVAVLGSDAVDVSQVDVASLGFGPARAPATGQIRFRDVNRDGRLDLVARFRKGDTAIQRGDGSACLAGELLDGSHFTGCDAIRTPPPR